MVSRCMEADRTKHFYLFSSTISSSTKSQPIRPIASSIQMFHRKKYWLHIKFVPLICRADDVECMLQYPNTYQCPSWSGRLCWFQYVFGTITTFLYRVSIIFNTYFRCTSASFTINYNSMDNVHSGDLGDGLLTGNCADVEYSRNQEMAKTA
mmetsp:Transcript_28683/g.44052  ORF Transcript_28683/g.44052 Transcript_28683/m.44052 type:complete len:152 (-) Transcript_28683:199-654(-)